MQAENSAILRFMNPKQREMEMEWQETKLN